MYLLRLHRQCWNVEYKILVADSWEVTLTQFYLFCRTPLNALLNVQYPVLQ